MMIGTGSLFLLAAGVTQPGEPAPINLPVIPLTAATAEGFVSPGWVVVAKAKGDLNRDGRPDLALALWTERASKAQAYYFQNDAPPYRLVVSFAQPDGSYHLVVDNKSLLVPPGFSGAYEDPVGPETLSITRGTLRVSRDLLRGHYAYKFRSSANTFRLIGYEYIGSDGRCITETSINFVTRKAVIATGGIGEDNSTRRFLRRVSRTPVTIEEASAEDYYPERDLSGPSTYCFSEGHRL